MDFKCIICNKDIKQIETSFSKDKPWEGCYSDGVVQEIHAGYGSLLDGNKHVIAICDQCLDSKTLQGKALYVGDYMNPEMNEMGYVPLKKYNE